MLPIITIEGNLAADPEMRFTPSGAPVVNFTVVASDRRRREDGNWEDVDTSFFRCSAWRRLAENVANSLHKGDQVIVTGKIKQREYETREGEKRTTWEVAANNVSAGLLFHEAEVKKVTRSAAPAQADPWAAGSASPASAQAQAQQSLDPWSATAPAQPDEPPF